VEFKREGQLLVPHDPRITISSRKCKGCDSDPSRAFVIKIVGDISTDVPVCLACITRGRDAILAGKDAMIIVTAFLPGFTPPRVSGVSLT
jgi:hypothetical protein